MLRDSAGSPVLSGGNYEGAGGPGDNGKNSGGGDKRKSVDDITGGSSLKKRSKQELTDLCVDLTDRLLTSEMVVWEHVAKQTQALGEMRNTIQALETNVRLFLNHTSGSGSSGGGEDASGGSAWMSNNDRWCDNRDT